MAVVRNASYVQAVELYVNENDEWMTDSETPLVTALYKTAETLDSRTTAGLVGEFRQIMKELHARKPESQETKKVVDPFDELVAEYR